MAKADLTAARLRELFHYDAETGVFTRRVRAGAHPAGAKAGALSNRGSGRVYVSIGINHSDYLAHRLAWLYVHGVMPAGVIDHLNGDGQDNRIANLRDTSRTVNNQNQRRAHADGSSRLQGVSWVKEKKRWRASITVDKKARFLGYFDTEEEAHALYVENKRIHHPGCTI